MTVTWQTFDEDEPFGVITDKPTRTGGEYRGPPFKFTVNKGIYVLELEDNNYYVGSSSDLTRRMEEHFTGNGSMWTEKHHPKRVVSVFQCTDDESVEDMENIEKYKTAMLMREHGTENVRGGPWAHPDLSICPDLPPHINIPD